MLRQILKEMKCAVQIVNLRVGTLWKMEHENLYYHRNLKFLYARQKPLHPLQFIFRAMKHIDDSAIKQVIILRLSCPYFCELNVHMGDFILYLMDLYFIFYGTHLLFCI